MFSSTKLSLEDILPLTCSRTGTCCHDKNVNLNPWEIFTLANAKGITPKQFSDQFCDLGGIRLRFIKDENSIFETKCSQYRDGFGCSVHEGRPLVCRLYPLGRLKQGEETGYMYQGKAFPCLNGCPEVVNLPHMTVGAYIEGQAAGLFETMQDAYLDFMQELADIAFTLLLETNLYTLDEGKTLSVWRKMGENLEDEWNQLITAEWLEALLLPEISSDFEHPIDFAKTHLIMIQEKIQAVFGEATSVGELQNASCVVMGLALTLGRGLGVDTFSLVQHWIDIAKRHGALEA